MKDISGKTAIVTGAASGIGLAIAMGLGEAGANVVMADIQKDAVEEAEAALGLSGANKRVTPVRVDVKIEESLMHWRKPSAHSASCVSPATMPARRCTAPG
jgi:NAD(P)-dependent dehydrogenase (short-subunit alcohol dehydrogenase family)